MQPYAPQQLPPVPAMRMPPALDLAVAEIAARQRALNGQPMGQPAPQRQPAVMGAPVRRRSP